MGAPVFTPPSAAPSASSADPGAPLPDVLLATLDAAIGPLALVCRDGRLLHVNRAFAVVLDQPAPRLVGALLDDVLGTALHRRGRLPDRRCQVVVVGPRGGATHLLVHSPVGGAAGAFGVLELLPLPGSPSAALALQLELAPGALPDVPGLSLVGRHLAADECTVGGDFFDVVRTSTGRVAITIGDVEGHGLPAAACMTELRTLLRVLSAQGCSPVRALARANDAAAARRPVRLATCAVLALDPVSGVLSVALAGHPPPVLVPAADVPRLLTAPTNLPLGCVPGHRFYERKVLLAAGDAVLLFSDGLVESRTSTLDVGLRALLAATGPGDLEEMVDRVVRVVRPPDNDDDLAVLAVRFDGPTG